MLKCIAIDDEPLALDLVRAFVLKCAELELLQTFEDGISGGEFLRNNFIDLLFVDINMPDINGIDLVRSLKEPPMIIFTTAYKKFAHEGFELDAVDYLVKPISFERFSKAVNKAIDYQNYRRKSETTSSLFVYVEYRLVKINLSDIIYIESLEDYIKIHLVNEKPIMTLMTMKSILEKLPADKFRRIHRSYIVSQKSVSSIGSRRVKLSTGVELPISDTYASFIRDWQAP